jgi:3-hydroxyisobutyrate dehydrogenase
MDWVLGRTVRAMSSEDAVAPAAEVVGFVGLGNMGGPMCRRLVAAGYRVVAFDLSAEALQMAVDAGAEQGARAADVAARCTVFLTSLPRPDHVESVMRTNGALAALRPGSLWVDLTTNRNALVHELADEAPAGVTVADSPVTGAVDGARNGRLTLFIGGTDADVARARPILEHLGRVIHCGPRGTGNAVKLVTNQLWFIHAAALGEAFALGMSNGVELGTLWEAIKDSVGDSFVARHDAPSIFAGHYDPSFSLDLCNKDLGLIAELAGAVGATLPLTDVAQRRFGEAADRYGPSSAELHVVRQLEEDARLSMRLEGKWTPPWEA